MLALPGFLLDGAQRADRAAFEDAFRLTGFFLARHVYEPRGIAEPEQRAAFLGALRRHHAGSPTDSGESAA
jgi:DNA repair protein RecO (recombination protein O)